MDRMLASVRQSEIQLALQRAQTISGGKVCCAPTPAQREETPLISQVSANCYTYVGTSVGLESMKTNAQNQCVINLSTDPTNPNSRFSQYRGPFIPPVCTLVPQEILNGNLPKASTACPLPNKPFYRSLA